jgi:hypothetical protein
MGPYIMTEVIPGGAYQLQDKKTGKDESNPWNVEQLRQPMDPGGPCNNDRKLRVMTL